MSPQRLFRTLAVAEAVTWALLLLGMVLKYVTETTDLAVSVFGMVHGVVFLGYCVTTVVVAVDRRWGLGRTALGLAAAVPPFVTVVFDLVSERQGALGGRDGAWRLRHEEPAGRLDAATAWVVRDPRRGVLAGLGAVAVLTAVALVAGPPAG
ncbi:MAG: hypothetical protein CMH83_20445 [Nocardioides sp.]|nr:hypothetical protein [Nocardioides sp.]